MNRSCTGRSAFTLVELLVGMIISSMILTAAAGVFVTAVNSWERGNRRYRLAQVARTTGDLIERTLLAAVPPQGARQFIFDGEDLSQGETNGHRLIFLSAGASRLPRSAPPTDMAEVEFAFDPAGEDGLTMRIDPTPDDELDDGGETVTLSPWVKSFKVLYYNGEEWVDEWLDSTLPKAVEFHLTVADDDGEKTKSGGRERTPETATFSRMVVLPVESEAPEGETGAGLSTGVTPTPSPTPGAAPRASGGPGPSGQGAGR